MKFKALITIIFLPLSCGTYHHMYKMDITKLPNAKNIILLSAQNWTAPKDAAAAVNHDYNQLWNNIKSTWDTSGKEIMSSHLVLSTNAEISYVQIETSFSAIKNCDKSVAQLFEQYHAEYLVLMYFWFVPYRNVSIQGTGPQYNAYCPNQNYDTIKYSYAMINNKCQVVVIDDNHVSYLSKMSVGKGIFQIPCWAEMVPEINYHDFFVTKTEFFDALVHFRKKEQI